MKLIDKDALVAKIDGCRDGIKNCISSIPLSGRERADAVLEYEILGRIMIFLNTLEVKEVDLEKEYDNEFSKDPVFGKLVNRNAGISIAKYFYELGLKAHKGE